jgi:ssDNA-binding Zn-finger/Zn-ribbon topoisomerase 1
MVRAAPEKGDYWFCSGFSRGCKITLKDHNGRPERAFRCPDCGKLLAKRKGKKGEFWGCTGYPDCTSSFNDLDGEPDL